MHRNLKTHPTTDRKLNSELLKTSKAIFCRAGQATVEARSVSHPKSDELVIDVKSIGLCRTDLFVFAGQVETGKIPVVPGHEFAGVVSQAGSSLFEFETGDRVVVNPIVNCGECSDCKELQVHLCAYSKLMGVDLDGACAEQVVVPASRVFRIPESVPFEVAAFAEPVAATLGMLNANIDRSDTGLLLGEGRIFKLAKRVLEACGFERVQVASPAQAKQLGSSQFDFVIETDATTELFETMIRLVRPRGYLVLKSRKRLPVELCFADIVPKQPILEFVNYGPFETAVELLVTGKVKVDDLIGDRFSLDQFREAIEVASCSEDRKTFLHPGAL